MFPVNSLFKRAGFFDSLLVSVSKTADVGNSISYYAIPLIALSCLYFYREGIYSYAQNAARNLPFFSSNKIKVGSENAQIKAILDNEFKRCIANMDKERSYSKKGRKDYEFPAKYYGLTNTGKAVLKISALRIVEQKITKKDSCESLKILDLGTGNGSFIYNLSTLYPSKIEADGMSALDTRDCLLGDSFSNIKYFEGNIERLFDSGQIKKNHYDVIFSSFCFMHLTDPILALINAYEALKEGGELYVDHFSIKVIDVEKLRSILHQKGYEFEIIGSDENIDYIHMIKNQPTLDLPIIYKMPLERSLGRQFMQYTWSF